MGNFGRGGKCGWFGIALVATVFGFIITDLLRHLILLSVVDEGVLLDAEMTSLWKGHSVSLSNKQVAQFLFVTSLVFTAQSLWSASVDGFLRTTLLRTGFVLQLGILIASMC